MVTRYKIRKVDGVWQVYMNRQGVDPDGEWVRLSQTSDWSVALFVATFDYRHRPSFLTVV